MDNNLLTLATHLRDAGISCIPVGRDKIPLIKSWGGYRTARPTDADLRKWFLGDASIALIGGDVQCIDFDSKYKATIFEDFLKLCADVGIMDVVNRCIVQRTPSGGRHLVFKSAPDLKNTKLAMCEDGRVAIETRGDGGYFLIAPSENYKLERGDFETIPDISRDDRDALLEAARYLDARKNKAREIIVPVGTDLTPGDDYDQRADMPTLLSKHGWTHVGGDKWRRPGKSKGVSATWGHIPNRLFVFSSSTAFEQEHVYRPWHAYAVLEHCGDYSAAARALAAQGYGTKRAMPTRADRLAQNAKSISTPAQAPKDAPRAILPPILPHYEADDLPSYNAPLPQIIKGVLHRSCKMIFSAPSKARKSFAMLDLGLSVAGGKHWIGLETIQTPVLYIDYEFKPQIFRDRRRAIIAAKYAGDQHLPFYEICLRGIRHTFDDLQAHVKTAIAEFGIGLVIFDPAYKTRPGLDENKASEVAAWMDELEQIAADNNAAIVFAHHYAKGNASAKDSIDRASGSGVFARDPDAILMLTQHEDEEAFVVEAHLRNFAPIPPFGIRFRAPLWERDLLIDPTALKGQDKDKRRAKAKFTAASLATLLKVAGQEKVCAENADKLAALAGVSKGTLLRKWRELKTAFVNATAAPLAD